MKYAGDGGGKNEGCIGDRGWGFRGCRDERSLRGIAAKERERKRKAQTSKKTYATLYLSHSQNRCN